MTYTYEKFAWPFWKGQGNPVTGLIPDEMMAPFLDGLREAKLGIERKPLNEARDQIIHDPKWTWEETKEFVRDVWAHVTPGYKVFFDTMHARYPTNMLPDKETPHMKSGGHCAEDGIKFRCDGSLSDPVYMAHESGHLLALERPGADIIPRNIVEFQAFFGQEAAYDLLITRGGPVAKAARVHRLQEYTSMVANFDHALGLLKTVTDKPDDKQDHAVWYIHGHPFAALVGISIYRNFKAMNDAQKGAALKIMYEGGAATTVADILDAFGVKDLRKAGLDAAQNLREEARALGFSKTPTAGPVPGSKPNAP